MKGFYRNNKQIINEFFIFSIAIIILFMIMNISGYTFGSKTGDFIHQHVRFIDYLRNSFWSTKDLLPQVTFNLGGSQNMANLFYYGQYNPLIMLSYLFPGIATMYWLQIMNVILIVSTFLGMNILLRMLKIKRIYVLVFSLLTALSPPLLFHFSTHIMFIYYYPIFIFSLIAIIKLIDNKIKWPFIICVALIFFTNFFFSLTIGFLQLMFFLSYLFFIEKKSKQEVISSLKRLVFCYIIGILIGMIIFIPQAVSLLSSSRAGMTPYDIPLIFIHFRVFAFVNPYAMGLGVFAIYSIVISFFNYKNKFTLLLAIAWLIMMISGHFNFLLNIFQYLHSKVYIYAIPIVFILMAYNLNKEEYRKNFISLIISSIFLIFIIALNNYVPRIFYLYIALQILLIILLSIKNIKEYIILIVTIALLAATVIFSANFISKKVFEDKIINNKYYKKGFYNNNRSGFYRILNESNYVGAINEYTPLMYTSVLNPDYYDFFCNYILTEKSGSGRNTLSGVFDNQLMEKIFGINEKFDKKTNRNVRPFIFGVEDKYISNISSLNDVNSKERIIALNDRFFVKDSNNIFKYDSPKKVVIKEIAKNYINNKSKIFTVEIPEKYRSGGIITIESNVISKKVSNDLMVVNKHRAHFNKKNYYKEPEKRTNVIYLNADEISNKISIKMKGSKNIYDKIKISYISQEDLNKNDYPFISPTNQKVDYNKSYKLDIKMPNNGYLGTSIFYDDGFIVKVDGKIVKKEKVNNNFLGVKLEKGNHKISIEYEMPGFKIGLVLSFIGMFILGFVMVDEVKILNRPFFRFVLVGVFNTVNYFIMYQLLLLFMPYLIAHMIGFVYSAFCSYFITTIYTFKTKPAWKTFIAFPITYLPNLLMSTFGTMFLVEFHIVGKSFASLAMMLAAIPITFIINRIIFINKDK